MADTNDTTDAETDAEDEQTLSESTDAKLDEVTPSTDDEDAETEATDSDAEDTNAGTDGGTIAMTQDEQQQSQSTPSSTSADARDVTEDEAEMDDEDFENQEWTLGHYDSGIIELNGMKFKVEEPRDDDSVERLLGRGNDLNEQLYESVQTLVVSPAITRERWENKMTPKERALLANEALEWYGVSDFIDTDRMEEIQSELR